MAMSFHGEPPEGPDKVLGHKTPAKFEVHPRLPSSNSCPEVFYGRRYDENSKRAELKDLLKRKYSSKDVRGDVSCTVAVFGDPMFTVPKHCVCQPEPEENGRALQAGGVSTCQTPFWMVLLQEAERTSGSPILKHTSLQLARPNVFGMACFP